MAIDRDARTVLIVIAVVLVSISVSSESSPASAQPGSQAGGSVTQRPGTGGVTSSARCPDLSGRYTIQGEDGQVQIVVEQHGCETIRILRNSIYLGKMVRSETHSLTLDGKVRADAKWFGGSSTCCQTTAAFVSSTLRVQAGATDGATTTITYSLNPQRDLLEEALTNGRAQGSMVARRQK